MSADIVPIRGRPLPGAYAMARMSEPCPNCQAVAHDWCRRADGKPRRVPCLARMNRQQKASNAY
jgi:hypothetical protein